MYKVSLATASLCSLIFASCLVPHARNAILELHIDLPATGMQPVVGRGPITHVLVQAESNPRDWSVSLGTDMLHSIGPVTLISSSQSISIDVEANGDEIERPLGVRVLYCTSSDCGTPISERWLQFDRAFYEGERTRYFVDPSVTTQGLEMSDNRTGGEPRAVGACQVGGCILETSFGNDYCIGGAHRCTL